MLFASWLSSVASRSLTRLSNLSGPPPTRAISSAR